MYIKTVINYCCLFVSNSFNGCFGCWFVQAFVALEDFQSASVCVFRYIGLGQSFVSVRFMLIVLPEYFECECMYLLLCIMLFSGATHLDKSIFIHFEPFRIGWNVSCYRLLICWMASLNTFILISTNFLTFIATSKWEKCHDNKFKAANNRAHKRSNKVNESKWTRISTKCTRLRT